MKRAIVIESIIASILIMMSVSAYAQSESRHFVEYRGHWHRGDIRHFEVHDRPLWQRGHWRHVSHGGRFGWWWIVGPSWYFYSRPIYPYPDPYTPPTVIMVPQTSQSSQSPPASVQNWYYCEASKEYYPYISTCPGGWKTVPAVPSQK